MDPRWCPVLLAALAVSLCSSPALADRKFGCLFEDELCAPYEFCVNDEVFGRCQELAGADLSTYDISSSGLQRLRILLQKLAHRGLTWQDDTTQQVISRELSKLRNVPLRNQATPPSPLTAYGSSRDRKLRPGQAELSRNLQHYLTGLGFLPHAEVDAQPGVQQEAAKVQNEDIKSGDRLEPSRPKPQQGWKETTIYSLQKGAGQPPVTKVFTQSGEGRHPKLSTTYSNQDSGRSKVLSGHLERLLSGAPGPQQGSPGGEAAWPKGKLHYLSYMRPTPIGQAEPQTQVTFGSKTQRPNLDRLLFKSGSNRLPAKEPLSVMDERFIQNMVNQLGRHSIHMEALMGKDLDQLAEVITGALQEVDEERPALETQPGPGATDSRGEMEANREPLAEMHLNQNQDLKSDKGQDLNQKDTLRTKQQGQQIDGADKEPVDKHAAFFSKLLDYLNMEPFGDAPEVNGGQPAPLRKMVGLESVHSRTMQDQVPVSHRWQEKTVGEPAKEGATLRLSGGAERPEAQVDSDIERWMQGVQDPTGKKQLEEPQKKDMRVKTQLVHVGVKEFSSRGKDRHFGYIITGSDSLTTDQGLDLMERLTQRLSLHAADLTQLSVLGPALTFRVGQNPKNVTTADLVQVAVQQKQQLEKETGLKIVEAGVSDRGSLTQIPVVKETRVESGQFLLLSVLCMLFILVALAVSATFFCVRQRSHLRMKEKLASLGTDTSTDATATYQELCRQRMAIRTSERVERPETLRHSRLNSVSSQFSDGPAASPSTRSSTSSWCEEPVPSNMDISTGHMILSYMEDHLKNKNRLEREWEALCSYQAEPSACSVGQGEQNSKRNRSDAVVVYDHSRITLKAENNHGNSDYINASPIMDHDPRNPTYIASQGPLASTVADFWQMVWESGCVVIVMLTPLSENGVKQCHHYWPDEGSDVYHIYEVNLVSEHIWCEDFLVRSFYLKNLQTNETRTVTQFHFLSWMDRGIPNSARTLLDFRRKVNKCYRGRSCPIIVHCSDGAGRSGTYILIDMVLNRMAKGAKEIDIAATLEHLRDQRAGMVQTKEQFEFALTAVAEEVNAILKALPQ
ncbi:receptor-type tyrosine-protein phosphatase N2 isoform X1 [Acanthochromis polyacanthus]|uniref:receptor-type tyrosine-protein phosphatase N2 isoform X1 n=1 Tax=Acanthochromis polyacanthus TaxID=80966 RepID=UPI002234DB4A|nr:receptor-type tyrosine-protein phosphatase N2 isoform X1 [Acanthochromis polyacanthus]